MPEAIHICSPARESRLKQACGKASRRLAKSFEQKMTMNFYKVLAIVFGMCVSLPTLANEPSDQDWKTACEKLKSEINTNKEQDIVFSKKPDLGYSNKYWVLEWYGIGIPIPDIEYDEVYITEEANGGSELFLIDRDNKISVAIFNFENEASKDIYATSTISNPEPEASEAGIKATRKIFGGAVRRSDLSILGYETKLSDLTCDDQNALVERKRMISLILKSIARPGRLSAVHKGVGVYGGWFEKLETNNSITYAAHILQESHRDTLIQVSYTIPAHSSYLHLPYILGNENLSGGDMPDWLSSLNSLLSEKTAENWKRYSIQAKKANISEKSIEKSRSALNFN